MSEPFGSEYANAYDLVYHDKDYLTETRLIERLLHAYGDGRVHELLDLGCGTGNHALPLAQQGYEVVGVDRSSAMLQAARHKAAVSRMESRAAFYHDDIRSFQLERSFDASLMMFAVLGYQLQNRDVLAALGTARKHTRPGGLFVFDVWYGPAVLLQGPGDRVKCMATEKGQILRMASGRLDTRRHLCEVSYHLWNLEGDRLLGESEETHVMRYFFPLELELFLECCGFTPITLRGFPDFDRNPDETTWNVCGVARAV